VVHDPQPLALPHLHGRGEAAWVWRCHIDSSQPNPQTWARLRPLLAAYDAAVFTLGAFVPPDVPLDRVEIIPPAIDPLSPKNMPIGAEVATAVLDWIGVDTARPLQVSRFDPWKDPVGVIAAYRAVKSQVREVQLALAGSMALDDPEGWRVYQQITDAAADDPDIFVFTNLTGVGNIEVNAFQRHTDVVIQKSLREGFGLVISEATWKGTPVVAGRAGGISLQLSDGAGGHLVDTVDQCAQAVLGLLADPGAGRRLAAAGTDLVRRRFLLPRLIGDELRLIASLLGQTPGALTAAAGTADEDRDPVCGMRVEAGSAYQTRYAGSEFRFWSASCERQFGTDPALFHRFAPHRATELLTSARGVGSHEVVVESRRHVWDLADGDDGEVADVLRAYRARSLALRGRRPGLVLPFRNHGVAAGTSLPHPHSQIVATPIVPLRHRQLLDVARDHYDEHASCLSTDNTEAELADGRRVVAATAHVAALAPYAARAPYEIWIVPRQHQASFADADDRVLADTAAVLRRVLAALRDVVGDVAYNYALLSAPNGEETTDYFAWHLQLVPRLAETAGFELGSGIAVNPVPPEQAADRLRQALHVHASGEITRS